MNMTKDQAEQDAIARWRALPVLQRQTFAQAAAFAGELEAEFDFRTMGNTRRVLTAWLIRDIVRGQEPVKKAG
ncbi:MAG: hypothetical protein ABL866_07205 [Devosia sp.]